MKTSTRALALSCVLLYAIVGFVAGTCPSSPGSAGPHQHHHKPAGHAPACAWACHASVSQTAIDFASQLMPVWLMVASLIFTAVWMRFARLIHVRARAPPPLFSV